MEFKSEAHKRVYEKTRDYMHTLFGEVNIRHVDDSLVLQEGSTFVYVRAFAIGEKNGGVEVFAYVAVDVDVTDGLMRYLLAYNLRLIFGAFALSVGPEGKATVLLTHSILGDSMGREELYASVSAVAKVADELDDHIVTAYGGKTALDKLASHQPAIEHWE
jgi:hypothetical protein